MLEPFSVDTLVVLACPFTKLVDEAMDGSKTVMLKEIDAATLKMQLSFDAAYGLTLFGRASTSQVSCAAELGQH